MTVYLQAPHELLQTSIQLPSPNLGDTLNPASEITIRNSMNGVLYSYVKSNGRIEFTWEFNLAKEKAIELEEFIKAYSSENIRVVDWRERVYLVKLVNLPISFSAMSLNERQQIRLQFEGVRLG